MSLLRTVNENEANGIIKQVYEGFTQVMGRVPNVVKFHTASPTTYSYMMGMYNEFSNHPTIDRELLTYLRVIIPSRNNGKYCIGFQSAILRSMGVSDENIEMAKSSPEHLPMDEKRKTLLLFAVDVLEGNHENVDTKLEKLRELGWSDKDIYEVCYLGGIQKAMIPIIEAFKVEQDF